MRWLPEPLAIDFCLANALFCHAKEPLGPGQVLTLVIRIWWVLVFVLLCVMGMCFCISQLPWDNNGPCQLRELNQRLYNYWPNGTSLIYSPYSISCISLLFSVSHIIFFLLQYFWRYLSGESSCPQGGAHALTASHLSRNTNVMTLIRAAITQRVSFGRSGATGN